MQLANDDYTVGWIAALPFELACAQAVLDEEHDDLEAMPDDNNVYTFGRIGRHNVVIAGLAKGMIGTTAASNAATNLVRSFGNIRFGLMVGVGGGVPDTTEDIRLGDIVVSTPINQTGGVVQYDFGTNIQHKGFVRKGFLRDPPVVLQKAVAKMIATAERKGYQFTTYHREMLACNKRMKPKYDRPGTDILYKADYEHEGGKGDCSACDASRIIKRDRREESMVHYGLIGSGNQVVRNAMDRDNWYKKEGILCFEMEAGGLMNNFECMVIRGICDYCDTHKNKNWEPYAAAMAAAYAKELLLNIPSQQVKAMPHSKILDSIHEKVQDSVKTLRRIEEHQISDTIQGALHWIKAPDAEASYRAALKMREPDTGKWFLESAIFKEWMTVSTDKRFVDGNTIRHLWMCGQAGSGKSILSATAIEELQRYCSETKAGLGKFYFTFSDQSKHSWHDCLKSLVVQLTTNTHTVSKLVEEHNRQRQSPPDEKILYDTLLTVIRSYPNVFIVLDALDESPADASGISTIRDILLAQLEQLATDAPQVKYLLTSRDLPGIRRQMTRLSAYQVSMEVESVNRDIEKYVDARLQRHQTLSLLGDKIKDDIKNTLIAKADSMFRWVQCQMARLCRLTTMRPSEIYETLRTLPDTLDKTYERMLYEIPANSKQNAAVLLRWLVYAQRSLTINELSETLIINLDPDKVDFDDRARRPEGVLDDLTGLVRTEIDDDYPDDDLSEDGLLNTGLEHQRKVDFRIVRVELAHFSVKEYLESQRNVLEAFQLKTTSCQDFLSNCCLTYIMSYADSQERAGNKRDLKTFPLLRYAAESWYKHYPEAGQANRATSLFGSSKYLKIWQSVHNASSRSSWPFEKEYGNRLEALPLASYCGLHAVVKGLVEKFGADVNAQGGLYGNALQVASAHGHENIVKLLIEECGADVNAQGGLYGSALQAASAHGYQNIVKILVGQYHADINAQGGLYGSALQAALAYGYENIVKLLVQEYGADVNAQIGYHDDNALQAGSRVIISIESGLVSSEGGKVHYNNLSTALSERFSKFLVEGFGVESPTYDGQLSNALQAASFYGHETSAKLLIECGADINAQGGRFGNALQIASGRGFGNIVKLLLEAKVDVNAQGGHFGNALQAARDTGHEHIAQMLIEVGAEQGVNRKRKRASEPSSSEES